MEGWIKIYRSSLNHWLYTEHRPLTKREAWETILLSVNYDNTKTLIRGKVYECAPGQSLLSLENWAKKFVWSVQQVRTFFKLLENDQMITTEGLQYTTRLTVCKWATYQGYSTDQQQTDNRPITDQQQTDNRPITTTKERKERKERKELDTIKEKSKKENLLFENEKNVQQESELHTLTTEKETPPPVAPTPSPLPKQKKPQPVELSFPFVGEAFMHAWNLWMTQPKQRKKPMSAHQLTLNRLSKFNEEFATGLVEIAASNGYQGCIFPNTAEDYRNFIANKGQKFNKRMSFNDYNKLSDNDQSPAF